MAASETVIYIAPQISKAQQDIGPIIQWACRPVGLEGEVLRNAFACTKVAKREGVVTLVRIRIFKLVNFSLAEVPIIQELIWSV